MKNARKKLELPMESATPCKVQKLWRGETCGEKNSIARRSKYACIVQAHEPTRKRNGKTQQKDHEDHIAGRRVHSLSHCNLVHKLIPLPQAMKFPDAKAAVDKEWETLVKLPAWQMTKVRSKKEAQKEGRTVHFATLMDVSSLKNLELEQKFQK